MQGPRNQKDELAAGDKAADAVLRDLELELAAVVIDRVDERPLGVPEADALDPGEDGALHGAPSDGLVSML